MSGPPEETPQTRTLRARQRLWAALLRAFARLELVSDRVVWGLRRRFGRLGPLQIVTYRSCGTAERVVVRGRLLEASVLERSLPADSAFRSFRRMLRRFFSREVPDAVMRAELGAVVVDGTTDDEGYFDVVVSSRAVSSPSPLAAPARVSSSAVSSPSPLAAPARVSSSPATELRGGGDWLSAEVRVVSAPVRGLKPISATAEILIPGPLAQLGIISDIDDTVLQTHVTQTLKMIWVTLSGSAFTRMPFEGTSELYHALVAGASGHAHNPVFYVSKSPWNLYDFLVDFLDHHRLPSGPLLLRDIGLHEAPPVDHKSAAVRQLLEMYPELPFVLVGDSGERDPEIYLETAARYPTRITAIYIRDLGGKNRNHDASGRVRTLCERALAYGTEMLWIEHASQALAHARSRGLSR